MKSSKPIGIVTSFIASLLLVLQSASASTAYEQWALIKNLTGPPGSTTDPAFDADPDNDGIKNGLEWVLGGNPAQNDAATILPHVSIGESSYILTFTREKAANNETVLSIEYGSDLTWSKSVAIGANSAPADASGIVVTINTQATPDEINVNIPLSNALGGKLFTRMKVIRIPPPTSIAITGGEQQNGTVSQPLPAPLSVTVKNEFGNPASNVIVQWVIVSGNGALSTTSSTTNSQGIAMCELTLGPEPGANVVTASVLGQVLTASFTSTAYWDVDANSYFSRVMAISGGSDPISTPEKKNINNFIVGLKNLSLWTSLADGWSFRSLQNIGTGTTVAALKSNAANATYFNSPLWSPEGVVVDGTDKYVNVPPINPLVTNFSVIQILKNRAFPSNASSFSWAARDSLTGISYKSQCLGLSTWSYIPTDPKWQIFRCGWDLLIGTYNRPPTQNTFYDLAVTADQSTPTTVKLYIGGSSNGATVIPTTISSPSGNFAPSTYGYRIGGYSAQGNHDGMDGTVSMSFIFNTQLLDTQIASVHNLIRSTIGQVLGLTVAAPQPPRAGTPSELIAQTGLDQSASTGQALPLPLTVLLKDSLGNPIPNALINWSVNVAGATLSAASGVTSAQGLASTALTLGSSPGAYVVTAQLNASSLSATFNATGLVPANASLTIESGNAQTGIVSISLASIGGPAMTPMVVLLKDASGNPIPRVQINWQVTQGEGTLISSAVGRQGEEIPSYASSVTDAAGKASMGLIMGDIPGPQAVLAAVAGGSQSISFSANAVLAADDHIVLVQNFGAIGDGVTDDQPALQAALDYARQFTRSRVVFEKNKIYRLFLRPDSVRHLTVDCGGPAAPISAVSLIGNGATLRSDVTVPGINGTGIIAGSGKWQGISTADPVIIHGLTFESTHGITDRTTDALGMNSRNQADAIKHIRIFGNTFKNFSRHVDIGGSQDVTITQNNFLMEKGYDSGAGGVNVGVWMYAETGSGEFGIFTRDTYVTNNFYDGLSTLNSMSEVAGPIKACGDGLIFGASINYVVTGNRIINFSYEGIYINYADYRGIIPLAEQTAIVTGNFLDGGKGGGWGIRTAYNNTLIEDNVMINIDANGIAVGRETTNPPEIWNVQVLNNDITMRVNAGAAIGVSNSHSARIIGNTVRVPAPSAGITVYGISAGGVGWHLGDGSIYYAAADMKLEDNLVQMKPNGDGSSAGTSIGIQIWHLTTPFSVAGNLVMDADQGLFLQELGVWSSPYTRADYEAGNQFLRCIKNIHQ